MIRPQPMERATCLLKMFLILCLAHGAAVNARASTGSAPLPGTGLYADLRATFYCDNLEYENAYHVGETIFGAFSSVGLLLARPAWDFTLGALLQRDFGDEEEISKALPLFRFRYRTQGCQILFGQIDSSRNHGLPEALLARQYPYRYPAEEGLQLQARHRNLKADLWINWYLLNTPAHREFFAAGLASQACWSFLEAFLGLRISHHGGQLYDVDHVSDNASGTFRLLASSRWPALDADFGASAALLGSYDRQDRDAPGQDTRGHGMEGECFISPRGWKFYYRIFSGKDFIVEQGEPLYRTEKPLHRFGLEKIFRLDDSVRARLQGEAVVIESVLEYDYSFVVDLSLDLLLHRFPAATE